MKKQFLGTINCGTVLVSEDGKETGCNGKIRLYSDGYGTLQGKHLNECEKCLTQRGEVDLLLPDMRGWNQKEMFEEVSRAYRAPQWEWEPPKRWL